MDIIFKDPPITALEPGRSGKYEELARALKKPENEDPDNPGKSRWAILPVLDGKQRTEQQARTAATNVRRGQMKDFPRGTFESVYDAEDATVYIRYIGEEGREETPEPKRRPQRDTADSGDTPKDPSRVLAPGSGPSPALVREWARTNGFNVPERGRLPENVIEAYRLAHQPSTAHHYATVPVPAQDEDLATA